MFYKPKYFNISNSNDISKSVLVMLEAFPLKTWHFVVIKMTFSKSCNENTLSKLKLVLMQLWKIKQQHNLISNSTNQQTPVKNLQDKGQNKIQYSSDSQNLKQFLLFHISLAVSLHSACSVIIGVVFLFFFVFFCDVISCHSKLIQCLGRAVFHDCGLHWVSHIYATLFYLINPLCTKGF